MCFMDVQEFLCDIKFNVVKSNYDNRREIFYGVYHNTVQVFMFGGSSNLFYKTVQDSVGSRKCLTYLETIIAFRYRHLRRKFKFFREQVSMLRWIYCVVNLTLCSKFNSFSGSKTKDISAVSSFLVSLKRLLKAFFSTVGTMQ